MPAEDDDPPISRSTYDELAPEHAAAFRDGPPNFLCLRFLKPAQEGASAASPVAALSRTGVSETNAVEQLPEGQFVFSLDYAEQSAVPDRERVTVRYSIETADPVSTDSP